MRLTVLDKELSIVRCQPDEGVLSNWLEQDFISITRTDEELSVVVASEILQTPSSTMKIEDGWKAIKVVGPLDFSMVGVLAQLSQSLAQAEISIFVISTFDTDYILVKERDLAAAILTLKKQDHVFV
ncbi:MAG: ACT domain-containing protein [Kangiellaceae bacterium]|nr:ACT domain-containing protein [Kangiellaceae bacterium]